MMLRKFMTQVFVTSMPHFLLHILIKTCSLQQAHDSEHMWVLLCTCGLSISIARAQLLYPTLGSATAMSTAETVTPNTHSLIERLEEEHFARTMSATKRARSQVGRHHGDSAKLQAIKAHFGQQVTDGELHGVVRAGKNLWSRVSEDWDDKERKGLKTLPQGFWPTVMKLYRTDCQAASSENAWIQI